MTPERRPLWAPDRQGTDSLKWARYADSDVLPMWVADMDFQSAPEILAALHERVDHGVFGYACPTEATVSAVVNWIRQRHGWEIQPEWIVWVPGLVPALSVVTRTFASASQAVMTFTPIYPPFLSVPKFWDRELITCPLEYDGQDYRFSVERFEETITENTRVLLLCSPHNPIGLVWQQHQLQQISEVCLKRGIIVCSDEIHCDLLLDPQARHIPTATLSEPIAQNTITLMSPAKTFNLPGLNCGFAVIPDKTVRLQFKNAAAGMLPHVNALGYTACQAAYAYGGDWLDDTLEYLRQNQQLLLTELNRIPGVRMLPAQATYLAWVDISRLKLQNPVRVFKKAGVGVMDGADFGGEGFIRINFACSKDNLKLAITRIRKAFQGG